MSNSRSEGIKLKPFQGAARVADLLEANIHFSVTSNLGQDKLKAGARMTIPPTYLEKLELVLDATACAENLQKLIEELYGNAEDFKWLLLGRDTNRGILRETKILQIGELKELEEKIEIKKIGEIAEDSPLSNTFSGFHLGLVIVLAETRPQSVVLPSVRGSIIAELEITVIPEADFDVILPLELTDEIRQSNLLPKDAWFFVDFSDEFLQAETFQQAMDFYVDPKVLNGIKLLPDKASIVGQTALFATVVNSMIFEASACARQLGDDFSWDKEAGIIPHFLLKSIDHKGTPEDFMDQLKNHPNRIAASAAARGQMGKRLAAGLELITEEAENVPNPED
jgi:hypothetical protein